MGPLSLALMPARALLGGAELFVATGRMVSPGGPERLPDLLGRARATHA